MREAVLPRGRIVMNGEPRRSAKPPRSGMRRIGTCAVLAIAGAAAIGVPMNALFLQDGAHPAPMFAGQTPPKPVEARVEDAELARDDASLDAARANAAKPDASKAEPGPAHAAAKRELAQDQLAALAADPALKAPRVGREPRKETGKEPGKESSKAKPTPDSAAPAKSAAKPAATSAAKPAAAPAAAKPGDKPSAKAEPGKPEPGKPHPTKTDPSKSATKKTAAKATTPKPPVKPAAAKGEPQPSEEPTHVRHSVGDLIGHLIGAGR